MVGSLLAWILLFSPPFLIRSYGKEVGYTLLAAPVLLSFSAVQKSLAICIPLLIFIGAANIFMPVFGNMIDEFSIPRCCTADSTRQPSS